MYLQWFWYIISLPTLISCTHNSGTARSVTESKKDKTLANNIFIVNVFAYLYACVCFNFLLSLKTFSFTCALLKSFFRRPLQQYFDAQPSQYIKRWCFDGLEMLWMSCFLVLIYRLRMICWYITRISEYIYNIILIYYSYKFLCSDQIVCYTLQVWG